MMKKEKISIISIHIIYQSAIRNRHLRICYVKQHDTFLVSDGEGLKYIGAHSKLFLIQTFHTDGLLTFYIHICVLMKMVTHLFELVQNVCAKSAKIPYYRSHITVHICGKKGNCLPTKAHILS